MIDHVGNGINIIDRLMAATGHWPSEKQLIDAVAAYGRAVERETWEQAARHCTSDACGLAYGDPLAKRFAEYFQYQSDHLAYGPAWERNKKQGA